MAKFIDLGDRVVSTDEIAQVARDTMIGQAIVLKDSTHIPVTDEKFEEAKRLCLESNNERSSRGRKGRKASFITWLKKQKHREDPIGDLSRDTIDVEFKLDPQSPFNEYDQLASAMRQKLACHEAMEALKEAWSEFSGTPMLEEDPI